MSGANLMAAVVGTLLATVTPTVEPSAPVQRPPFVACPVAAVPSVRPGPPPDVPPPARDRSRPTLGGDGLDTAGLTVPAGAPALPTTLSAKSWLVADLDTGAVLGACGPHEYGTPASVQKLLLAATLLPKLDPAQVVTVVAADLDIERASSAVGLLVDGRYTVETLWLGLLLNSGNDAANTLARVGGGPGGVAGTLAAMNAEARRLGAYETHAVTPHGLDGPGQFTSVYDLALIARVCFAREDFRRYTATQRAQMPAQPPKDPRGFQIQNNNQLLYRYPGAIGGKTGFTDVARHTYVGAAERGGRRLVATVLGAELQPVRTWQQAAGLLDWGFALPADARVGHLVTPEEVARAVATPSADAGAAGTAKGPGGAVSAARGFGSPAGVATGLAAGLAALAGLALLLRARRRAALGAARRAGATRDGRAARTYR
jgi:D-alanyl-D-alanine carboxypeptidase (penicillin-binding protein 5/6)